MSLPAWFSPGKHHSLPPWATPSAAGDRSFRQAPSLRRPPVRAIMPDRRMRHDDGQPTIYFRFVAEDRHDVEAPQQLADFADRVLETEPVVDAEVPCPQCGERAWDLVQVRSESEAEYTRWKLSVCRACGRIEDRWPGGTQRPARPLDAETERELADMDRTWSSAEIVREAPFPVFVLAPDLVRAARIVEWSRIEGRFVEVTVERRARVGRRLPPRSIFNTLFTGDTPLTSAAGSQVSFAATAWQPCGTRAPCDRRQASGELTADSE